MTRRPILLALATLIVLPACGGDDDPDAATATDATADETADETASTDVADSTVVPTTAPATTPPDTAAWCAAAEAIEAAGDAGDAVDFTDPAAVEDQFTLFLTVLDDAVAAAPDEIADDVVAVRQAYRDIAGQLEVVEWDFLDLDMVAFEEITSRADDARERIEAYNEATCGIPDDDEETGETVPSGSPTAAGTIREQLAEQLVAAGLTQDEATCLADNVDLNDDAIGEGDVSAILEWFAACDLGADRLAELGGAVPELTDPSGSVPGTTAPG